MSRYFVSAGWPYLYDIPGLHNCVPMLFADVYARFLRATGNDVHYLCGADEHGSRVEFVARGTRKHPRELVDEKVAATLPLLEALGLEFDGFGRTSDPQHREFVQGYLRRLQERDKVRRDKVQVAYCAWCGEFLPDRFVVGSCPSCHDVTYGGHCSNKRTCGRYIAGLDHGACALCGGLCSTREREHLVMDLSPYRDAVLPHLTSDRDNQPEVRRRVEETFDSMRTVTLTRDTGWGIPVPGASLPGRSIYSWVDSLLGKVSHVARRGLGPESDYWRDASTRRLFFLGMDGVPFYGALLPSLLLAAGEGYSVANWTILPNEVLIYEGGVCSKSSGTGIWLPEALNVLEGDLWRFYVFYNYATSERDVDFQWEKFTHSINRFLVEGLESNVMRVLSQNGEGGVQDRRLEAIQSSLANFATGAAFRCLLEVIIDPEISWSTLRSSMDFLSCFTPRIAARALRKLEGEEGGTASSVGCGHLEARALRRRYEALVDDRRSRQALAEEITSLRADALCVCPVNLAEQ